MFAPDTTASIWAWVRLGIFLPLLWFVPGWIATARWRGPLAGLNAFLASLGLLFGTVLLFSACGVPVTLLSLVVALQVEALLVWQFTGRPTLRFAWPKLTLPSWRELWWLLPVGFVAISVVTFAASQPLSGFDNIFRWNHLSLILFEQGSLAHYPAVTPADFRVYPWCDGIPPLVPVLNASIYLAAGSSAPVLTVVRIAVELGITLTLVWLIASQLWGGMGARFAVLALASSSLFGWSLGMGQESGLAGVMLLSMAAHGIAFHETKTRQSAWWLMAAAAGAALCRDYNLLFIPLGVAMLWIIHPRDRSWVAGLVLALALAAPWYLRNAIITGNPLYPHGMLGLFPTNYVHDMVMAFIKGDQSSDITRPHWTTMAPVIGLGFGPLLLFSLPGLCPIRRTSAALLTLVLALIALWVISLPYTAGGWVYALRVLGSGLPLLAVAAGWWGRALSRHAVWALAAVLALFCVDAGRRSWFFVWQPMRTMTPYTWTFWRDIRDWLGQIGHPEIWQRLHVVGSDELIITDHPATFVHAQHAGLNVVPPYSAEAAVLTATPPEADTRAVIQALRRQHVRFVVLSMWNDSISLVPSRGMHLLQNAQPDLILDGLVFYDIARIARGAPPTGLFDGESVSISHQ